MRRRERIVDTARRAIARTAALVRRGRERLGVLLATTPGQVVAAGVLVVVLVLAIQVLSGGGDDAPPTGSRATDRRAADRVGLPERVVNLLEEMPVERKVAQLMLVGPEGTDIGDPVFAALEERDYAGLVIDDDNYVSPDQVEGLADEAVSVAEEAEHVTPWVMAAQEGGEFSALADLPPVEAPADLGPPGETGEAAEETAVALQEVGVTGVLGPVVDVGTEPGTALGARLYSDEPEEVSEYARATIEAFEEAGTFSAAKHFPGLGGASQSPELGTANVGLTLDELAQRDLVPFEAAIEAGVPGIVVGHGLYGVDDFVTPASMSNAIMTDLLRDDLGFPGVAIADDMISPAITAAFTPSDAAVEAVRSGADLVYVSVDDQEQRRVYEALLDAVRRGQISRGRLDEAVTRTLLAKERSGQLEDAGDRPRRRG